jgi:hypothetical protein
MSDVDYAIENFTVLTGITSDYNVLANVNNLRRGIDKPGC